MVKRSFHDVENVFEQVKKVDKASADDLLFRLECLDNRLNLHLLNIMKASVEF